MSPPDDRWAAGEAYEDYMGRWSRPVAERFLGWLGAAPGLAWLEIGCGSGALTSAICAHAAPASLLACDPSEAFAAHTRAHVRDPRVEVVTGDATDPPARPGGFDCIVSGLVLNFVPEPERAVAAMRSRLRPDGVVAAYVWDYAGRMDFLRIFWEETLALDPAAAALDERTRFPVCEPQALARVFHEAGARDVRVDPLDTPTRFPDFADYWRPFLGGTGPAPSYVASLDEAARARLRERLERRLPAGEGGAIDLIARAWAVRGSA